MVGDEVKVHLWLKKTHFQIIKTANPPNWFKTKLKPKLVITVTANIKVFSNLPTFYNLFSLQSVFLLAPNSTSFVLLFYLHKPTGGYLLIACWGFSPAPVSLWITVPALKALLSPSFHESTTRLLLPHHSTKYSPKLLEIIRMLFGNYETSICVLLGQQWVSSLDSPISFQSLFY